MMTFRPSYRSLLYLTVILFIISSSLLFFVIDKNKEFQSLKHNNYDLIDPAIAKQDVEQFLENQHQYTVSYAELRKKLEKVVQEQEKGVYGIYFEDFVSGAWLGINERELFLPSSLLKVPAAAVIMKKVEEGKISLDQKVTLIADDIDLRSGQLGLEGEGYTLTVRELLDYALKKSDNTAAWALLRQVSDDDYKETLEAMGVLQKNGLTSPKSMSNVFRSLYLSSYLRRSSSNYILSSLSQTEYSSGLPQGLPEGLKIAHKIGFWLEEKQFHDCGIVYFPDNPYLICIMTKDLTKAESDKVIKQISTIIYQYMDSIKS